MNKTVVYQDEQVQLLEVRSHEGVVVGFDAVPVGHQPLRGHEVIACLNAVLGVWSVQDAANAAGVEPAALVAEAQAWAAAAAIGGV